MVLALLEDVDVGGSVITLDALHTTRNTALAIRRRHGAHYLFTVKGNAPETFQTLATIDWDRDATARFSEPVERAHCRIERRQIQVLKPLRGLDQLSDSRLTGVWDHRQNAERLPGSSRGYVYPRLN